MGRPLERYVHSIRRMCKGPAARFALCLEGCCLMMTVAKLETFVGRRLWSSAYDRPRERSLKPAPRRGGRETEGGHRMAINPEPRVTIGQLNANTDKAHVAPCTKVIYRLFALLIHSASTTALVRTGYFGRGFREKALYVAGAIGLSLMVANYAKASQGKITINNMLLLL